MDRPILILVREESQIPRARQEALALAEALGFPRTLVYSIATAASELASNLAIHAAGGGLITLSVLEREGATGIELVSEDQGPGIADLELAMTDGYSSAGGLGGGLPGVKRLMDEFEIESEAGRGTRVTARKWYSWK